MFKNYLLIFSAFLFSLSCFCQNYSKEKIYSWYDGQTGMENSSLFRGIEYVEAHRMINEKHKFFEFQEFQKGSVTYDGQTYHNLPLKYNIYDNLLLVNLQQGQRNSFFQLFSDKVDEFQINGHKFQYLQAGNNTDIVGFYEVINEDGDFKIFKKHVKNMRELRDKNFAYNEFGAADPDYIFQFNNEFFELDNRRDLFSKFPDLKNEIRGFYRTYRKQSKNYPDAFMKSLANEMNAQISNSTN